MKRALLIGAITLCVSGVAHAKMLPEMAMKLTPVPPQTPGSPVYPGVITVADSATPVFDGSQGTMFRLTFTQNIAPVVQNMTPGNAYYIEVCQDAVGSHSITIPSNVVGFPGGVSTAANKCFSFTLANFGGAHIQEVGNGSTSGTAQ